VYQINQLREGAKHAPSLQNSRVNLKPGESREELTHQADELQKTLGNFELTAAEKSEKRKLLSEGFDDWSKKDFRSFCASMEHHGRYNLDNIVKDIVNECGKSESEVKRYFVSFWLNYKRISDWKKILDKVEKGEKKILRLRQIRDAIHEKVERHIDESFAHYDGDENDCPSSTELLNFSWPTMRLNYAPGTKNRAYTEEEDAFLLCMMHRHGYGAVERIRMEIRRAPQFRFDWYFKSRNSHEIQKRCDAIVKMTEKEIEDIRKREEEEKVEAAAKAKAREENTAQQQNQEGWTGDASTAVR
jgi:SWI/SNF-related matrix-associated actin-dependent regulator of chromatin subfamily A member 5